MYSVVKAFITVLAIKEASSTCDIWAENTPTFTSADDKPILLLADSSFNSTNPDNPVISASIFFQAIGSTAPFKSLGCPSPLIVSQNETDFRCTGLNITAAQFTNASHSLEAMMNDMVIGTTYFGYGTYQPQGSCPEQPLSKDGIVFGVRRALEKEHSTPALRG